MKKPDEETKKEPENRSRTDEIREAWYKSMRHNDGYADEHEPDDDDDEIYNAW